MAASTPTGKRVVALPQVRRQRQGGFTYLAILFAVAVMGVGLAVVGEVWSTASQRDKERELLRAGREIRAAIGRYHESSAGGLKRYPGNIEDLLKDNRFPQVKRHLRRIPRDPVTGEAKWNLIAAPGGGFMGVTSLSEAEPLKKATFDPGEEAFDGKNRYADWQFVYVPPAPGLRPLK